MLATKGKNFLLITSIKPRSDNLTSGETANVIKVKKVKRF